MPKLIDIEIDGIKAETDKAYLVVIGKTEAWVPKSQVELSGLELTLPEWLAMDKGLI
jgi:hypothetical protein